MSLPEQQPEQLHNAAGSWDIFLSHSGAQKGFAKGLFQMLKPLYNVFFDISHPSLPPAHNFVTRIFHAAKTCRLALVVLSNEFICSKWPMLELSAFVSAGVKILPLFYELTPSHLKDKQKLKEWHRMWEELASSDGRIDVSLWDQALHGLRLITGPIFIKLDGELAYLNKIVSTIYKDLPPRIKFSHSGIHGAERLCKVFIDKFEELEQRPQCPSEPHSKLVSVLGLYGLPGSGKTTLCECALCDQFYSHFAGRALHLKLPSNPTPMELLKSAKELLKLTNYRHHHSEDLISNIVDLPQVYSFLKASNLRSSKVFLVIDNISSQDSLESVEAILQLGVGAGSRVMLVARTLKILHPLLLIPKYYKGNNNIHYVCDSMRVPSINENEAIRVLMQSGGGLGLAATNYYSCEMDQEECSNSRHKEIITRAVHVCAFNCDQRRHQDLLYLPLALKIIGSQLRVNYGMDLEKWEIRQLSRFEAILNDLKEDAVRKIVAESFQNLPEKLKLLFLDVALFMVPAYRNSHTKEYLYEELLSFMHESSPDTIRRELNDLIRLCFLELGSQLHDEITVHDVFLEFAKSVSGASSMYYDRRRNIAAVQVTAELRMMLSKSKTGLRALILELDEKCERFDFPAGFSSVKVVIVRNCESLAVLGLAGLTSLVSFEVENCPRLRCVELDPSQTCSLKRVSWRPAAYSCHQAQQQQQGSSMQSIVLGAMHEGRRSAMQVKQLISMGWCRMLQAFSGWPQRPLNYGVISLARELKNLEVLRLERTGISSLPDLSNCWPQLRVLEVLEDHLEQLELGKLPNLKQFFLGAADRQFFEGVNVSAYKFLRPSKSIKPRMLRRPNLLAGCPKLEDVRICKPDCEDGMGTLTILSPNLRTLFLKNIHYGEPVLPDFTSSAHSLEQIVVWDHWVLESIEFPCQFWGLVQIELFRCPSLVKITGLEFLPHLRYLTAFACRNLQALGNLEGESTLLEKMYVAHCPNLQFLLSDLKNLTRLKEVRVDFHNSTFKLKALVNLESLEVCGGEWQEGGGELSLCCNYEEANNWQQVKKKYSAVLPLFLIGESAHLCRLFLCGVQHLVCLDGIQYCLLTLTSLTLQDLPHLTCLQGVESLIHLDYLRIKNCMSVEELPSLCTLVNMEILEIIDCANLKSVEGCDRCKNLELGLATIDHWLLNTDSVLRSLGFYGCKFASIKAMIEWVLDEKVSKVLLEASVSALVWEFVNNQLREKPKELGLRPAEKVVPYLLHTPPLDDKDHFDFQSLEEAWSRLEASVSFPRDLMGELPKRPIKDLMQQCQSDAQFRLFIANYLFHTCPRLPGFAFVDVARESFCDRFIGVRPNYYDNLEMYFGRR